MHFRIFYGRLLNLNLVLCLFIKVLQNGSQYKGLQHTDDDVCRVMLRVKAKLHISEKYFFNSLDLLIHVLWQYGIESTLVQYHIKFVAILFIQLIKHITYFISAHGFHQQGSFYHIFYNFLTVVCVYYIKLWVIEENVFSECGLTASNMKDWQWSLRCIFMEKVFEYFF